jgi:hypothetical protein
MNFVERVMRVMTHVNIGIAMGLVAWVAWSGWQVVTGQIVPDHRPAEIRAAMNPLPADHAVALHREPTGEARDALPPCHASPPATASAAWPVSGGDL